MAYVYTVRLAVDVSVAEHEAPTSNAVRVCERETRSQCHQNLPSACRLRDRNT